MNRKYVNAVSFSAIKLWGCPDCGYRSGNVSLQLAEVAIWRCGECRKSCTVLVDGFFESLDPTDGKYARLIKHPRESIPAHGRADMKPDQEKFPNGEFFRSRGLGLDSSPGCFVCGGEKHMYNNIAAYVETRESGERIVTLFGGKGARLDYRVSEPDYVQVKIGACDEHKQNLQYLHDMTNKYLVITPELIANARK